ncbi:MULTISPECIES: hypothetical protein [Sphingomonas]|uniref:hypothetical protein n=1 Tax=Sphingomonas TaxID=13687 RepID=UPI00254FC315|nr:MULTISPECIES: hypothetical protein [Sphingomonas]
MFGLTTQSSLDAALKRAAEAEELVAKLTADRDHYKATTDSLIAARNMWKGVAENVTKQRDELRAEQEQVYKRYEPFMNVTRGPGGRWTSLKSVGAGA